MKIEEPIIEHDPPVEPEKSEGGINSYCISCAAVERQAGYPVCLHTIRAIEENRIRSDEFVDCQRALTHDKCKAKAMRDMERKAGKALFYRPRNPFRESTIATDAPKARQEVPESMLQAIQHRYPSLRTKSYKPPKLETKPEPKPKATIETGPVAMDMGQMASALAQQHQESKPKPGESVREWARRIAGKSTT